MNALYAQTRGILSSQSRKANFPFQTNIQHLQALGRSCQGKPSVVLRKAIGHRRSDMHILNTCLLRLSPKRFPTYAYSPCPPFCNPCSRRSTAVRWIGNVRMLLCAIIFPVTWLGRLPWRLPRIVSYEAQERTRNYIIIAIIALRSAFKGNERIRPRRCRTVILVITLIMTCAASESAIRLPSGDCANNVTARVVETS